MTIAEHPVLHASLAQPAPRRTRRRLRQPHRFSAFAASRHRVRHDLMAARPDKGIQLAAPADANYQRHSSAGSNRQLKSP